YDVIFLDVRMPGLDGVELGRVLRRFAAPPQLVFVSAYDSAAVDAFELQALDYLRKPVGRHRLEETLERAVTAVANGSTRDARPARARRSSAQPPSSRSPTGRRSPSPAGTSPSWDGCSRYRAQASKPAVAGKRTAGAAGARPRPGAHGYSELVPNSAISCSSFFESSWRSSPRSFFAAWT